MATTTDIEKLQDTGDLFALLTLFFLVEPKKILLKQLLAAEAKKPESRIDHGLDLIRRDIEKNANRLDAYQGDLAVEFARLFLGPQNPVAVPYASFYLSEARQLMTDITLWVRQEYLDAGMAAKELHRIPDDHIALELEFVAWLAREGAACLERGEIAAATEFAERLQRFSQQHLEKWLPLFAEKILENSKSDFFRGAAIALQGAVKLLD